MHLRSLRVNTEWLQPERLQQRASQAAAISSSEEADKAWLLNALPTSVTILPTTIPSRATSQSNYEV
jgi:hypothetical protein